MNAVANHTVGKLQGFKSLPMYKLLLQRSNDALHHSVSLRAMGRDELVMQFIALDQGGVTALYFLRKDISCAKHQFMPW